MKTKFSIKPIWLFAVGLIMLTASCSEGDNFDFDKNVILVTGTDNDPLVKFVVENTPSTYIVTASATEKVTEDVAINFAKDNSLVAAYNTEHKTNYYEVPESAVEIDGTEGIIKAGQASSTGISVKIVSTADFKDGRIYIIPITITGVKGGGMDVLEPSKTIYLRISRVISFTSLDMTNVNLYSSYIAPDDKIINLPNYTYEIKCYANSGAFASLARLCNFGPKDESVTNLLRFGESGLDKNSLQWVSPAGGVVSTTRFNTEQWYTISLTFDGSTYKMFVDGVKDAELASTTGKAVAFQRLELGMSWTNYPSQQAFRGRIAEIRLWDRALSTSEIKLGICGVDPATEGLVAYWKFNEGTGYIFHDATGNGYDMDWSDTWREAVEGQGLVNQDKSSYVNWLSDDKNKCNQ